ncbi:MAG TPA: maleylpyruvate isomerase family mycothiol-dependent enzyme [Thermomicrobiales bacterium]|nr:maleylpyruvate isomerase family mycothiol-dependent enzyme [Thermomicrobiales bacterium]
MAYKTAYLEAQARIRTLVNNQNADVPVPGCPGWTVKDVVAHLTGVFDDIQRGNLERAATEEWSAGHIAARREKSLTEIGAEWHLLAHTHPYVFIGDYSETMYVDLICHEFDIRGAIGNKEARYLPDIRTAALFFLTAVDRDFHEQGVPALRVQVEDKYFDIGDGEPQGQVTLRWFELFRVLSGRRSRAQVAALPWEGDPETWLDRLFILGPAEQDIAE